MEIKVLVQGPDTIHPIVVSVPDEEDPQQKLATAMAQGTEVLRLGTSTFRTDRVLAIVIQQTFVDSSIRNTW
jgi:hypothetical protein